MDERLSPVEAIMWRAGQDAALRMTVGNLMVLDQAPPRAALEERLAEVSAAVPRLRQRPDDSTGTRRVRSGSRTLRCTALRTSRRWWRPHPGANDRCWTFSRCWSPNRSILIARRGTSRSSTAWRAGRRHCTCGLTTPSPTVRAGWPWSLPCSILRTSRDRRKVPTTCSPTNRLLMLPRLPRRRWSPGCRRVGDQGRSRSPSTSRALPELPAKLPCGPVTPRRRPGPWIRSRPSSGPSNAGWTRRTRYHSKQWSSAGRCRRYRSPVLS